MLKFDILKKQIDLLRKFNKDLEELEIILGTYLLESKLVQGTWNMFDVFIDSHFTINGKDLIYWWLYEDVPKIIYLDTNKKDPVNVEELEDLWKYMEDSKEVYFL